LKEVFCFLLALKKKLNWFFVCLFVFGELLLRAVWFESERGVGDAGLPRR